MQLTCIAIPVLPTVQCCAAGAGALQCEGDSVRSGMGWEDGKFIIHVSQQAAKHLVFIKQLLGKHMVMLTACEMGRSAILKTH